MTREEAIALAKRCAVAQPHSYMGATIEDCIENFMPHEWVIEAILQAANGVQFQQLTNTEEKFV